MNNYIIINGLIIMPEGLQSGKSVVVENGVIIDITSDIAEYQNYEVVDAGGNFVTAGLVETHIHGCGNYAIDSEDENGVENVVSELKKSGINYLYATVLCHDQAIINIANELERKPHLLNYVNGIYIEGPFVSMEKRGGILPEWIRKPDLDYLKHIIRLGKGFIRMMTVAPELENVTQMIDYLIDNNIIPALGHSGCSLSQINSDIFRTKVNITHLFNAMSPVSHRVTGLAALPFLNDEVFFELNSDGIHVSPEVVCMCHKHLNHNRLVLITDAVPGAGSPYGKFTYNGKTVVSDEKGIRYADNDILCGSNCLMNENIRRFIKFTHAPLHEVIKFATLNPCRLMGVDAQRGSIEKGKIADIVIFDSEMNVVRNLF